MKNNEARELAHYSAYHGGTWKTRSQNHSEECQKGQVWPFRGPNSEFASLEEVSIYVPPQSPPNISKPEKMQHLRPLDWKKLAAEGRALSKTFSRLGVKVTKLEADWFPGSSPNLMFVRDLFFVTPWGAILGRLASPVRAGEERWGQLALAKSGIPILEMIRGTGHFEGADALWVTPNTVAVGVGNRTNREGFKQLKNILAEFQVRAIPVPLTRSVQHLLGILQIIGPGRALVRTAQASVRLLRILQGSSITVLPVPESDEVVHQQGMNLVTLSPNRIVMPANCRNLRSLYESYGIQIAAEVPVSQYLNAAGGIGCATGVLSRTLRSK
jgi:N-dimethylarginine dimethylaminohydrolase